MISSKGKVKNQIAALQYQEENRERSVISRQVSYLKIGIVNPVARIDDDFGCQLEESLKSRLSSETRQQNSKIHTTNSLNNPQSQQDSLSSYCYKCDTTQIKPQAHKCIRQLKSMQQINNSLNQIEHMIEQSIVEMKGYLISIREINDFYKLKRFIRYLKQQLEMPDLIKQEKQVLRRLINCGGKKIALLL